VFLFDFSGWFQVAAKAVCPICKKSRAERYCPALGEKICAVDCGTGRETTIDCPSDCGYLIAAHRWEVAHPKELTEKEIAFPDVSIPAELISARRDMLSGLSYTVLSYAREHSDLTDSEVFAALQAMAETVRTLTSGIYYEKPPQHPVSAGLYAALAKFIDEEKIRSASQPGVAPLKDLEIFYLLVFLLRFGQLRSNGRPRTREFTSFLRTQFSNQPGLPKEEPRIIMP
jgi:hypothetical protein